MSTGVTVDFNANLARFTSGIDRVTSDLNRFQSNAARISGNITKAFAGLGVGIGVGAFAAVIKSSVDAQDHLLDLSKTTRLTVEQLSGLSLASKKSGSDLDGTAKAINKLAVEMGKDADKFKALGVTAKNPLEAFGQLADAMNAIDDPQTRAAVGAVALGKSWEDAAPLMAEGSSAIAEMIKQGEKLSNITTESAQRADKFNDKLEDLKALVGGWATAWANPIVDGFLKIGNALNLEIDRKPGSISEFLFGPKNTGGASGGWGDDTPASAGKPTSSGIKAFIGGEGGSKKTGASGKTALQRSIELGQRNLDGSYFGPDEPQMSVDDRLRIETKAMEDRAQAMDEMAMARMEMYRIETEGEEAVRLSMEKTQQTISEMDEFAKQAARGIQDAFADFLFDPFDGGIQGMLDSFGKMLRQMAAQAAAAQLSRQLFGDFGTTGKIGGLASTGLDALSSFFAGPDPAMFASGGVVDRPTAFKFASGGQMANGLMGEAGPEAILPLSRGPGGKLGVRASGGGMTVVNNFTVSSPTDRRTQEQIAAMAGSSIQTAMRRNR